MVEWSYHIRPKNSSPHCVLLGHTDDGSFTKATEISAVRRALASVKARLTMGSIAMELGFLASVGVKGFWKVAAQHQTHYCKWQEGQNGTQDPLTCRDLWHQLIDHGVPRGKADGQECCSVFITKSTDSWRAGGLFQQLQWKIKGLSSHVI